MNGCVVVTEGSATLHYQNIVSKLRVPQEQDGQPQPNDATVQQHRRGYLTQPLGEEGVAQVGERLVVASNVYRVSLDPDVELAELHVGVKRGNEALPIVPKHYFRELLKAAQEHDDSGNLPQPRADDGRSLIYTTTVDSSEGVVHLTASINPNQEQARDFELHVSYPGGRPKRVTWRSLLDIAAGSRDGRLDAMRAFYCVLHSLYWRRMDGKVVVPPFPKWSLPLPPGAPYKYRYRRDLPGTAYEIRDGFRSQLRLVPAPDVDNALLLNINVKSRLYFKVHELERVFFDLLGLYKPDGSPKQPLEPVQVKGHMLGKLRRTLVGLQVVYKRDWLPSRVEPSATFVLLGLEKPEKVVGEQRGQRLQGRMLGSELSNYFRRLSARQSEGRGFRFRRLPLVNIASKERPRWLPAEMFSLKSGQPRRRIQEDELADKFGKFQLNPADRKQALDTFAKEMAELLDKEGHNVWKVALAKAPDEGPKMVELPALRLPQPYLRYGRCIETTDPDETPPSAVAETAVIDPGRTGAWANVEISKEKYTNHTKRVHFRTPGNLSSYAVILVGVDDAGDEDSLKAAVMSFMDLVRQHLQVYGVKLPTQTDHPAVNIISLLRQESVELTDSEAIESATLAFLQKTMKKAQQKAVDTFGEEPKLLFCIMPRKWQIVRSAIKRWGDARRDQDGFATPTQCILAQTVRTCVQDGDDLLKAELEQIMYHLCQKINLKLSNIGTQAANWELYQTSEVDRSEPEGGQATHGSGIPGLPSPAFVIAISVTHPQEHQRHLPSTVASVVYAGVKNKVTYLSTYTSKLDHQQYLLHSHEITEHIEFHRKVWKSKKLGRPVCMLCIRQGVPQNQFQLAYEVEYKSLVEQMQSKRSDTSEQRPFGATYVVVQRMHGMRLFPVDTCPAARDEAGNGNVVPGTLVDRVIMSPHYQEFLLNSHKGILGTNRPALYKVIADSIPLGEQMLPLAMYWLTFIFERCTRSIADPAPLRLAKLASERAQDMLEPEPPSSREQLSGRGGPSQRPRVPPQPTDPRDVKMYTTSDHFVHERILSYM